MRPFVTTDISPNNLYLEFVYAFRFLPKRMYLSVDGRLWNGILYIKKGGIRYKTDTDEFSATEGMIVYIPIGSHHQYWILSPDTECIEIDFYIKDKQSGMNACFADHCFLISNVKHKLETLITKLMNCGTSTTNELKYKSLSYLYSLIAELLPSFPINRKCSTRYKLLPALSYLESNFNEEISIQELAKRCCISEPYFRKIFKEEFGVSPLKYRTNMRMNMARNLLSSEEMNVSEVAASLGFANVFQFSKVFKKTFGMSPSDFKKN